MARSMYALYALQQHLHMLLAWRNGQVTRNKRAGNLARSSSAVTQARWLCGKCCEQRQQERGEQCPTRVRDAFVLQPRHVWLGHLPPDMSRNHEPDACTTAVGARISSASRKHADSLLPHKAVK